MSGRTVLRGQFGKWLQLSTLLVVALQASTLARAEERRFYFGDHLFDEDPIQKYYDDHGISYADESYCVPKPEPVEKEILSLGDTMNAIRDQYGYPPEKVACVQDASDKFDPGAVFKFGANKGKCIDAKDQRPPVILADNERELVIANFRHGRQWWIAHIPKEGIDQVYMQTAELAVPLLKAAHGQFHFTMKPGYEVRLESQKLGQETMKTTIKGFMISSEPFIAKKHDYVDSGAAIGGNIGIDTRFLSEEERIFDDAHLSNRTIENTPLKLTPEDQARLLSTAAHYAQEKGYTEDYRVVSRHCIVRMFEILDRAFPEKEDKPDAAIGLIGLLSLDPVIGPAYEGLLTRGLIDRDAPRIDWNQKTHLGKDYIQKMADDSPYQERAWFNDQSKGTYRGPGVEERNKNILKNE